MNNYLLENKPQMNADKRRYAPQKTLYEKILTAQHRTQMTQIRRIFTDTFNPCASVSSVKSVFYHHLGV
ncbi:hypothetical protein ig2599ANME_0803 [groundwater metagenome]